MSGFQTIPPGVRACPFCGMVTDVPHETQEGCIEALHAEIDRTRNVLASLKPAALREMPEEDGDGTTPVRLALSASESR